MRKTTMESGGTSSPTGPFVNNAIKIHTGRRILSFTDGSPALYILWKVLTASTMNMHISISILSTTAVPRNITDVSSIIAAAILSWTEAPFMTQPSITFTITKAGMSENIDRARQLCSPKTSLQSMTIQK